MSAVEGIAWEGIPGTAFDLILCGMIVAAALAAVGMRDRFGAVVFFILYGIFVSLAWVRLDSVDVALAEAALGAGLTGLLLLGAISQLPGGDARTRGQVAAVSVGGAAVLALGWAFLGLPHSAGLADRVAASMPATGVENPVTAVLLGFRGWDTLLETVVLVTALIGVWSVSRDGDWGTRPGLKQHVRPAGVLATFGRLLPPVGLLLGVYLVWAGSSRHGGAFQGGVVLAAVALLANMAGLVRVPPVSSRRLRLLFVLGPAAFLAVGLAGAVAGSFLGMRPDIAKPLILGIEALLTVSIAATLALLVVGPPEPPGRGNREK